MLMNGCSNSMTCLGTGLPASRDSGALFEILRGSICQDYLRTLCAERYLLDFLSGFCSRITT